jgi:hypothetical protein
MKVTPKLNNLITKALAAGYSVDIAATAIDIYKSTKSGRIIQGVRRCEDGTAYRLDVINATNLPSYAAIERVLGLN